MGGIYPRLEGNHLVWQVFSDFDNTISLCDVTDALLQRFAAPEWQEIESRWEDGKISSRVCMEQQIALVSATKAEVDELVDGIEIDPGFIDFAAFCNRNHIPLTVLSDGLDYVISRILRRYGLVRIPVVAGHFEQISEKQWKLSALNSLPLCASDAVTCKCYAAQNNTGASLLYIGDGRSDFCVVEKRATLTLAKKSLLKHCQEQQLQHLPFHDFVEATAIFKQLVDDEQINSIEGKITHAIRS